MQIHGLATGRARFVIAGTCKAEYVVECWLSVTMESRATIALCVVRVLASRTLPIL